MATFKYRERVTARLGPDDDRPECPTCAKSYYVVPDEVVAEFDGRYPTGDAREALRHITVTGTRWRQLKAGARDVGKATIDYPGGWCPAGLWWLVFQMYDAVLYDDAEVARRHVERVAYNRERAAQKEAGR